MNWITDRIMRVAIASIFTLVLYFVQNLLQEFISSSDIGASNSHEAMVLQNVIQPTDISQKPDDIGGIQWIIKDIRANIIVPLRYPHLFFNTKPALRPSRGVLFHGPPGTGKTMLARYIACESKRPFISMSLNAFENKWFGETSKILSATFTTARKLQPCVLFMDELDGILRSRTEGDTSAVYGMKTEFLTHMDGIRSSDTDSFIVIGCTNCLHALDKAVLRRFADKYELSYPDKKDAIAILNVHLKDARVPADDVQTFSEQLKPACSGADIANIVQCAWKRRKRKSFTSKHFEERVGRMNVRKLEQKIGRLSLRDLTEAARAMKCLRS